jgi:hypothetical protein
MPASSPLSPPQPPIEATHDHPVVGAEAPEQTQPGTLSSTTIPGDLQRSPTLESLLDALDGGAMAESTVPNNTPPSTPHAANTQAGSGNRHVPAFPVPVIAAPIVPRAPAPPSPTANQPRLSISGRILVFFGYGRNNRARKELVSVICAVVVDVSQVSIQSAAQP